ncbi:hypothetical protein Zmor_017700 [Zophobas morio]|uniref:RNA-directed DNA polymerase n=1 Tax=Zophobas morio TaxID=2755281 RepID=A0AA38I9Z5_9CUCU|nr:hypothetical protein Zmor_017700 [Zophobas morio]
MINNIHPLTAIVDTGADVCLSKRKVVSLLKKPVILPTSLIMNDVQGHAIPYDGLIHLPLQLDDFTIVEHDFIVVPDEIAYRGDLLIGLDFLGKFKVQICWASKLINIAGCQIPLITEGKAQSIRPITIKNNINEQQNCFDYHSIEAEENLIGENYFFEDTVVKETFEEDVMTSCWIDDESPQQSAHKLRRMNEYERPQRMRELREDLKLKRENTVIAAPYVNANPLDLEEEFNREDSFELRNIGMATPYDAEIIFELSNSRMATPFEAGIVLDSKDIVAATPYEDVDLLGLEKGFELEKQREIGANVVATPSEVIEANVVATSSREIGANVVATPSEEIEANVVATSSREIGANVVATPSEVIEANVVATSSKEIGANVVATPSEVIEANVVATSSRVIGANVVATPSEVIEANVVATSSREIGANVVATPSEEIEANVVATSSREIGANVVATPSEEIEANVVATSSRVIGANVVATPSEEIEANVVATSSKEIGANVVATPSIEIGANVVASPSTGAPEKFYERDKNDWKQIEEKVPRSIRIGLITKGIEDYEEIKELCEVPVNAPEHQQHQQEHTFRDKEDLTKSDEINNQDATSTNFVTLLDDIKIPPRSQAVCQGALSKRALSQCIVIEPLDEKFYDVLTTRVMCINEAIIPVRMANITERPITLEKGTIIGKCCETINADEEIKKENCTVRKITIKETKEELQKLLTTLTYPEENEEEKQMFENLIAEFTDIFRNPDQRLTCTSKVNHRIITENVPPISRRPYKVPFHRKDILNKEIQTLIDNDIIQESQSPWSAPAILIEKKRHPGEDPEFRLCIDYRELNKITKPDFFPLPILQDTLDQLQGASLFSIMDMASGYFQIEIQPEDREITGFSTPYGHYEFKRMAMGLRNAPSTWQRLMYNVFNGLVGTECLVYLDDVIVFSSNNIQEHIERLRNVFIRMRESNLKFKPTKCNFLLKEAKYLGHIISAEGCRTDPAKIKAVEHYPRPKSAKEIKAFLGLCGFYRKFVPKFAALAKPLTTLTKKDTNFEWKEEQQLAFDQLRTALMNPPILKYPDFTRPFILVTDASGIAVSAILAQKYTIEHPISYASRILKDAETRYSTIERELLAIVWAVKHFKAYLIGKPFTIYTDHRPLKYLFSVKDPNSRLARWAMCLMEFDFEIEYRPGKRNHVDSFTRLDYSSILMEEEIEVKTITTKLPYCEPVINNMDEIKNYQKNDHDVQRGLKTGEYYLDQDGVCHKPREELQRHEPIVIPRPLRYRIIQLHHDTPWTAHGGAKKTTKLIQQNFFWKGMTTDVKKYCQGCHSCNLRKHQPKPSPDMQKMPVPCGIWGLVSLDIVGPLHITTTGNRYILTCMDYLTRYPECIPLPDMKAKTIARAFVTNIVLRHGTPRMLLTDCGTQFLSELFQEMCRILGIEKIQTSPYRPSTNGVIERMHHVLKTMLSHYISEEYIEWDEMIPFVVMAYRNRVHESTKETPFFLMHGRDMELPFHTLLNPTRVRYNFDEHYPSELMARMQHALQTAGYNLERNNQLRCDKRNKKTKYQHYQQGDKVYLFTPAVKGKKLASKFYPKWSGPYRVITQTGPVNYLIKEIGKTKELLVHESRMKPWRTNLPSKSEEEEEELELPTRKPTRDSEISSEEDEGERKIEKRILEDLDGLQRLFTFEEETSSEEEEEEANQAEEEVEIEESSDDEDDDEEEENGQPHPYHTRSKGRAPEHPWVLRKRI